MGHSEQARVEGIRREHTRAKEVGRELRVNPETGRMEYVKPSDPDDQPMRLPNEDLGFSGRVTGGGDE